MEDEGDVESDNERSNVFEDEDESSEEIYETETDTESTGIETDEDMTVPPQR